MYASVFFIDILCLFVFFFSISFFFFLCNTNLILLSLICIVQGVFEMRAQIVITSYWLHVELGKNIKKIRCQKIK
jgi:hypothetical protein